MERGYESNEMCALKWRTVRVGIGAACTVHAPAAWR